MTRIPFAAALLLPAAMMFGSSAQAAGLRFNSMPVFVGQVVTQHGEVGLGYQAQIMSTTPDAQGYIEIFTYQAVQTQESYADHLALQTRAKCDATGDNSCVLGKPGWQETLLMVVSQ